VANNLKLAFTVTVTDHANQQAYEARLVLILDRACGVEDFKLTPKEGSWPSPTGILEEGGFTTSFKETLGLELEGASDENDADAYDNLSFDGEFAGHYCQVSLEAMALQEDDDGE
jgi:hypothetical protein